MLPPPAGLCATLQTNLDHEASIYAHLDSCIGELKQDIARRLAATPGALLPSGPGMGLVLSSRLFADGSQLRDEPAGLPTRVSSRA